VLIATGLQIHFAGARSLARTVAWHNAFAAVLLVNGFLSLFYHLTTSAIARFFPPRRGIYARLVEQARFYTEGIFFGWPHPSPKTPERRLNPLQQVTYLALLNILLPLQALSGVLIWGASRWPALVASLGGLTLVAPLHNLGAWIFLAFLMLHLYLTTTGRTVLSNLKAMIDGYDHLEHPLAPEEGEAHA
jgi:thiosulfate reductase cytochrome b subunit